MSALAHQERTKEGLAALSEAVHLLTGTLDLREVLRQLKKSNGAPTPS